jgi:hypothetical protein
MKNKKIFIIGLAIVLATILTYIIYAYQSSNQKITPIPATKEQKDIDASFSDTKKVKPKSLEAVKLPDKISSSFERISGKMLGFIGNDQVVYTINLDNNETKQYELPEDVFSEEVKFLTFNEQFTRALIGFSSDQILELNLENKSTQKYDLPSPLSACSYQEIFYILNRDEKLKISSLKAGSLSTVDSTTVDSEEGFLTELNGSLVILSENGTYTEEGKKISDAGSLTYAVNSNYLALLGENSDEINIEIYNQKLNLEKKFLKLLSIKSLYLMQNENTLLATVRLSEKANDKLIKMDFDGNESEIVLPDQYPDFLREYKFDKILFGDNKVIYYADQGNVFKINL